MKIKKKPYEKRPKGAKTSHMLHVFFNWHFPFLLLNTMTVIVTTARFRQWDGSDTSSHGEDEAI